MLPSLPSRDPNPQGRAASLEADRARYTFDRSIGGLPLAAEVPKGENYSPEYLLRAAKVQFMLTDARVRASYDPRLAEERDQWEAILDAGAKGPLDKIKRHLNQTKERGIAAAPLVYATDLGDFEALLSKLPPPSSQPHWQDDAFFAWQRIGGCNPAYVRQVATVDPDFAVTAAHFDRAMTAQGVADGDSLDRARSEGRLFWLDHRALDGLKTNPSYGFERYLYGPMALFVRTLGGPFLPVAIQCRPTVAACPVVTPGDGVGWTHAKLVVQSADAATQGLSEHLGMCHVFSNAVLLCTGRQLAQAHPVRLLLWPHFEMTLAANETMKTSVIGEKGFVDQLQGPALDVGIELAHQAQRGRSLADSAFHRDLELRGVADRETLPEYVWRDDAGPIHAAVRRWVGDYLALYYGSDAEVVDDPELRAWVAALSDPEAGDISGIPSVDSVAALAELVTEVIVRITAYHNVINYGCYDYYGWMPNLPTARWGPIPDLTSELDPASLLAVLPPVGLASYTLDLVLPQRELQLNALGQFARGWFADPRVSPLVKQLQSTLEQIEQTLTTRDEARRWSFPWLRPSRIAQSIHV